MDKSFEIEKFFSPPNEFGIVSFYWWVGEEITKERLTWQLDRLTGMDICGLQINYCHTDTGGHSYGLSFEGEPKQLSDEWWSHFGWFLQECQKRDISVSLSDYTLGTPGQGYYTDWILQERPDLAGGIIVSEAHSLASGEGVSIPDRDDRICCVIYPTVDGVPEGRQGKLFFGSEYTAEEPCLLAEIFYASQPHCIDPCHPDTGAMVIDRFFAPFEAHNPGQCGKGLNFFFSDELNFGINGNLWNKFFAREFKDRKDYDILPYLYGIFADIGPITQKIRLDYYDVIVQLENEYYFEPVYRWHEDRRMTYGCDHGGRGYDVTEFGDYFRTQKYNQGPGNDQSSLGYDLIKNKVSASIAHLYDRPRTWLEGFHSSGWNMGTGELFQAICRNFAMGHNLLSLHGLYYTTYGGFWEWAPPCNHFRMPYWQHMKKLTSCVKRMSYMNTRGHHACDAAILYPVAAVEGGIDGKLAVDTAFELGRELYAAGVDFDFLDFESLINGEISDGKLLIAGKAFRTVILPAMRTVRFGCLEKLQALKNSGGQVLCVGAVPEASERAGREDPRLDALVAELIPGILSDAAAVLAAMDEAYPRDFRVMEQTEENPYFTHRTTEFGEMYMVYGLPQGTVCHFRATGNPVLLDGLERKIYRLSDFAQDETGTSLALPLPATRPQYIIFAEENTFDDYPVFVPAKQGKKLELQGTWESRLLPTMDNTYGDFAQPPEPRIIGAQIRQVHSGDRTVILGHAPYYKVYGPVSAGTVSPALAEKLLCDPENANVDFKDYYCSMRYGAPGDPGHQGWHGLKKKVSDDFLTFGRRVDQHRYYFYEPEVTDGLYFVYTYVYADGPCEAELLWGKFAPAEVYVNGSPAEKTVTLKAGYNLLSARFAGTGRTHLVVRKTGAPAFSQQMPLAMNWYGDPAVLPMDADGGKIAETVLSFDTPPGCKELHFSTTALISATFDGENGVWEEKNGQVALRPARAAAEPMKVVLKLRNRPGRIFAAAVDGYIETVTGIGQITTGDWGKTDGLAAYSGGVSYGQTVILPEYWGVVRLHLGNVNSTAEVFVNGKSAGVLIAPPYTVDITDLVTAGENCLEIHVYNTLYNHYTTIPTKYNAPTVSGLLGPVWVELEEACV